MHGPPNQFIHRATTPFFYSLFVPFYCYYTPRSGFDCAASLTGFHFRLAFPPTWPLSPAFRGPLQPKAFFPYRQFFSVSFIFCCLTCWSLSLPLLYRTPLVLPSPSRPHILPLTTHRQKNSTLTTPPKIAMQSIQCFCSNPVLVNSDSEDDYESHIYCSRACALSDAFRALTARQATPGPGDILGSSRLALTPEQLGYVTHYRRIVRRGGTSP